MNSFEIVAIIGAAAWIYPFAVRIIKLLTKTELEVINHRQVEIGYSFCGPILNINLAFSAENKDGGRQKGRIFVIDKACSAEHSTHVWTNAHNKVSIVNRTDTSREKMFTRKTEKGQASFSAP